jgi:hypothetical protein
MFCTCRRGKWELPDPERGIPGEDGRDGAPGRDSQDGAPGQGKERLSRAATPTNRV